MPVTLDLNFTANGTKTQKTIPEAGESKRKEKYGTVLRRSLEIIKNNTTKNEKKEKEKRETNNNKKKRKKK